MDALIEVMNQLHEVFSSVGLHVEMGLPQIAVVGGQSVGKSSVLESIVGRDFLPRGTGIVTRRPLVLQLHNNSKHEHSIRGRNKTSSILSLSGRKQHHDAASESEDPAASSTASNRRQRGNSELSENNEQSNMLHEWGQFSHSGQIFDDFAAIRREIERETDRLSGKNKGIVSTPIHLKIYSPNVIDLTLVDLPGVTKVPVGDQPTDIEEKTRELINSYIKKPNCLILAVHAANTDIANSDSLGLARSVDPEGLRTIGVVTKLDMMDEGTDGLDMLEGRIYSLRLGYTGIVCRNAKESMSKSVKEAIASEEQFFRNHAAYRSIAHRCGIPYLSKLLNRILMYHIRDGIPDLKGRITKAITDNETELSGYGDLLLLEKGDGASKGALVLHLFSKFTRNFSDAIDGKRFNETATEQLSGGARIHHIFHDIFAKGIHDFDCFFGLSDTEIRTAIRNATGPRATLFVPEAAFELLVKKQIEKLEEPCLHCVEAVFEEMERLLFQAELPEMQRFVNLRESIFNVVRGVLKKCLQPTNQMILNLIQIELAYINTNHPDFIGGSNAIQTALGHGYAMVDESNHESNDSAASANHAPFPPAPPQRPSVPEDHDGTLRERSSSNFNDDASSSEATASNNGGFFAFLRGQRIKETVGPKVLDIADIANKQHHENKPLISPVGYEKTVGSHHNTIHLSQKSSAFHSLFPAANMATQSKTLTARERVEINIIKTLIASYFNIVKKNICDAVPKTVMYFMVNTAKDVIQRECVAQLYKEELFDRLLEEGSDIKERRKKCKDNLAVLRRAVEILNQIRDHTVG